ncbi:MAG: sulfide-dependent adenosine diphosphate thiazole synthase [Archaeoglobaceae archaeon]
MTDEITVTRAITQKYHQKFLDSVECDIAIVGGGPSGLVAAFLLGKEGFKVSLFEKKLSLGGGIWGGGMMYNQVVVQEEATEVLDEFNIDYENYEGKYYTLDAIEMVGGLVYHASRNSNVFNLTTVEDVMIKKEKMAGLVLNWTAVEMAELHIDPLTISSKAVVDATGHEASVCNIVAKKTEKFELWGEGYMDAESADKGVVEKTSEVFPGLYVTGMSVAAFYGLPRMGPIFGGMLLSGKKVAELVAKNLS